MRRIIWISTGILCLSLVTAGCNGAGEPVGMQAEKKPPATRSADGQKSTTTAPGGEETVQYRIAMIHAGKEVRPDDQTVETFAELLESIERKTKSDQQEIMDMTVRAQQILDETGKSVNLLDLMRELDDFTSGYTEDYTFGYSEIATAFLTRSNSQ